MPFCPSCGLAVSDQANFCTRCGANLANMAPRISPAPLAPTLAPAAMSQMPAAPPVPPSTPERTKEELIELFVGDHCLYYREAWRRGKDGRLRKHKFNLAAFFLTVAWFGYRKMYGYAWGLLALIVLINLAPTVFQGVPYEYVGYALIGVSLSMGLSGSGIYRGHAEAKVSTIKRYDKNNVERNIAARGGTSLVAGFAFLIMTILLLGIVGSVEANRFENLSDAEKIRNLQESVTRDSEGRFHLD